MKFSAFLFVTLLSLHAQAQNWFGVEAGYQQTAPVKSLTEDGNKTGSLGMVSLSRLWTPDFLPMTFEPSAGFFLSTIKGNTTCCGSGRIDTQAFLFELPVLWQFENVGVHFRPGVMLGEDLDFNISPTGNSRTALLSLGADVFHSFQWQDHHWRAGAKWTVLPADPRSLMASVFLQLGFGEEKK